jgi:hypothetical protein
MSAALESTYRRAMRWYPKRWRAANEDAVLGTLLDQAEEQGRAKPARGELSDLRANGLARRLGPLGRVPASVRDRMAALAFGLGVGISIVALVVMPIQAAAFPSVVTAYLTFVGPYIGFSFVFYGLWILSAIAGVLGWTWIARALVLLAIPVSIAVHIGFARVIDWPPTSTTIILMSTLAVMSLLGNPFAFRRGRLWIAVSALGWAAFDGFTTWYQIVSKGGAAGRTDWSVGDLWMWLYWIVPFAVILALVLHSVRRNPWGGAILLLLVPLTAFVVFGWKPQLDDLIDRATLLGIGIAIIAVVYLAIRLIRVKVTITRA